MDLSGALRKTWQRGVAVPVVLILLGLGWNGLIRSRAQTSDAAASWPTTEAVIRECEVIVNQSGDRTLMQKKLSYDYSVDGRRWRSEGWSTEGWDGFECQSMPPGATVVAHYNPARPGQAVLRVGQGTWQGVQLAVGWGLIGLGGLILLPMGWALLQDLFGRSGNRLLARLKSTKRRRRTPAPRSKDPDT